MIDSIIIGKRVKYLDELSGVVVPCTIHSVFSIESMNFMYLVSDFHEDNTRPPDEYCDRSYYEYLIEYDRNVYEEDEEIDMGDECFI